MNILEKLLGKKELIIIEFEGEVTDEQQTRFARAIFNWKLKNKANMILTVLPIKKIHVVEAFL